VSDERPFATPGPRHTRCLHGATPIWSLRVITVSSMDRERRGLWMCLPPALQHPVHLRELLDDPVRDLENFLGPL